MEKRTVRIHYDLFALLLAYPDKELLLKVEAAQEFINNNYPDAAETMIEFTEFARETLPWKWEEIYTRTFDVQAITTLDVGYVLFGDDYKRGELLVNLNKEHTKAANDCKTELSDHLPNLLRLLNKVNDNDFKNDLVYLIIKPGLKKIISEFDNRKIEKKNKIYEKHHNTLIPQEKKYGTVYKYLLKSLLMVLDKDFDDNQKAIIDESQFQTKFANEMELPD